MSKNAAARQKAVFEADVFATPASAAASSARHVPQSELAVRLFSESAARSVIVFAAVHRGAGVTTTVCELASLLGRFGKRVAVLDSALRPIPNCGVAPSEPEYHNVHSIQGAPLVPLLNEQDRLAALRAQYDCILIDCGALSASIGLLRLASVADGVVVIVEAGKTTKPEIDRAIQLVHEVHGTLLGFVLNKRRYPVPSWIYRFL